MSSNSMENENERGESVDPQEEIDSIDYTIKHPLQHCWTLWYYENDRSQNWTVNQKEIASIDTVEDFWSLYNHIKFASELKQGCDYSLFKKNIKPMWEDTANKRGGRWLINLERRQRSDLDRYWLDILLCLIGEAFENSNDVNGAVVNVRAKGDKLGIWTSDTNRGDAITEIGRKLKDRLRITPKTVIGYHPHAVEKPNSAPLYSV